MQAQQRILINALVVVGVWTLLRTYFTTLVVFETTEPVSNNRSSTTSLSIPGTSCGRYSNTTGTWNGTKWVPPTGWRIYESNELRTVYRDQTILWMGDSTAARAAILHYGILSKRKVLLFDTDYPRKAMKVFQQSSSAACTKRWGPSSMQLQLHGNRIFERGVRKPLCLPMPNNGSSPHEFLYMPTECYFMLEGFLRDEIAGRSNVTLDVDVLILGTGVWEVARAEDCGDVVSGRNRSMSVMQRDVILLVVQLASVRPHLRILWRTMGYIDSTSEAEREAHTMGIDQLNKEAIVLLEETLLDEKSSCQVSDVDWGGSVRPRSFQKDRIEGDCPPHYGLAARINQLQMVTNTLYGNSTV